MTPPPVRDADAPAATAEAAPRIAIVGAGPAGLAAAWELSKLGRRATVYEMDRAIGGISRTAEYRGFRFDLGGHRFFTKSDEAQAIWDELLGGELLERPRLSRIFYRGRFFDYPLRPLNALFGLGPVEATRILASYVRARLSPDPEERTFDTWVSNRFGRRLFEIFFATYTEKVWGIPCSEISADWAAQRIKNLDLLSAVRAALFGNFRRGLITTLIDRFQYPRLGPGMMWERCAALLAERGTPTVLGCEVGRIRHRDGRVVALELRDDDGGARRDEPVDEVICSMPLGRAAALLDPPPHAEVLAAARGLRHRDFLTVVLILDEAALFPDNWIYVHSPEVRVGRIQNFKNWSPEMVPDPSRTALGLEYFVQRGDEVWSAPDEELIALAARELEQLGLAARDRVVDGTVVRVRAAYPLYDGGYAERVATVRAHLERFPNLQMVGRNGQHRYNNQDHSMLTGVYAARNLAGQRIDIWSVNVDGEYHEETSSRRGDRAVPGRVGEPTVEELLAGAFQRYDSVALGAAVAATSALSLWVATSILILRGGEAIEPTLSLLAAFLAGFSVSWGGALLGSVEAGVLGYLLGFLTAGAVNLQVARAERTLTGELAALTAVDALDGAAL